MSTVQDRISLLEKRKLIAIKKHKGNGKYKNNIYVARLMYTCYYKGRKGVVSMDIYIHANCVR